MTKRIYMETDEIKRWKALTFQEEKKYLERDRDIFLFKIYTGYYYKDLQIYRKDQLIGEGELGFFLLAKGIKMEMKRSFRFLNFHMQFQ